MLSVSPPSIHIGCIFAAMFCSSCSPLCLLVKRACTIPTIPASFLFSIPQLYKQKVFLIPTANLFFPTTFIQYGVQLVFFLPVHRLLNSTLLASRSVSHRPCFQFALHAPPHHPLYTRTLYVAFCILLVKIYVIIIRPCTDRNPPDLVCGFYVDTRFIVRCSGPSPSHVRSVEHTKTFYVL